MTLEEHLNAIDEWVQEVVDDQGLDADECYGDVVKAYLLQLSGPDKCLEPSIRRCTGVVW